MKTLNLNSGVTTENQGTIILLSHYQGQPPFNKLISIPSILTRVLPIRAEPGANATIKGKNTHYRPVQLLHQDGVDPPGGGGVRISSIVSFSLGVNGAPLTRSRAMM